MKWTAPSLLQLVDRQVKSWSMKQEAQKEEGATKPLTWPPILISREFGAMGERMARTIGERLKFSVWDRELVEAMAKEEGVSERLLGSVDENRISAIDDAISGAIIGSAYTNSEYLRTLMSVVHTIAAHGSGVIVGRGARYILKPEQVLSVRVVGPLNDRIRGYAERVDISVDDAREIVLGKDRERDNFIRRHFKRERGNMSDYDLVVNTTSFTLEQSADFVLAAYGAKFGSELPTS